MLRHTMFKIVMRETVYSIRLFNRHTNDKIARITNDDFIFS